MPGLLAEKVGSLGEKHDPEMTQQMTQCERTRSAARLFGDQAGRYCHLLGYVFG
jgi:uncharacterized protein YjaZ